MLSELEDLVRLDDNKTGPCAHIKCARPRAEFPMAFRSDPYCSDNCRKAIGMDLPK